MRRVVLKHRHMIPKRPLADHDSSGVHTHMTRQPFELLGVGYDLVVLGRPELWLKL